MAMAKTDLPQFSVSDFIASVNQTLEYAYASFEVIGEVSGFKVNQSKYVFFDLKDEAGSIGCFMTVWQLRVPIEDGMKIIVTATPKLTQWGKFSLTVRAVRPHGEGSLKKSFELLRAKLEKEGLFASERKRPLPALPSRIGVISSTQAAGYADFMKILDDRFGGLQIEVAQVQVQGASAPDQMIRALKYFTTLDMPPEVIVLIRGGGSADDLSAFNDELLVREIAASRVPTLVGVGHETDTSLSDLAADVRAATPSNAAQILVPDWREIISQTRGMIRALVPRITGMIEERRQDMRHQLAACGVAIEHVYAAKLERIRAITRVLRELDPHVILRRGYALVRGKITVGAAIEIEKSDILVTAEVTNVKNKR